MLPTNPFFTLLFHSRAKIGSLSNDDDDDGESEFTLSQNSSLLFHGVQFGKFWRIFLELNSKRLYLSLKKN